MSWLQADKNLEGDPLSGIGALLGSPGELADFVHQLWLQGISPDFKTLSSAFQEVDHAGQDARSLAGLASGQGHGMTSVPEDEYVEAFTEKNCSPSPNSVTAIRRVVGSQPRQTHTQSSRTPAVAQSAIL